AMQAKLLRVLEEREVRPVGSNKTVPVDVRLVAATHRDLHQRCSTGEFREDLLYRLQVVTLELPPLRERKGDVRLLARHFLSVAEGQMGRAASLDGTALAWLEEQPWPGNVRQLENAIQRAVAISAGQITIADLAEA
ncbi:MAG: sigma 54-interacting transcriptional regulator, partial [Planctomycetota bacterium]|nr:sigma 54-interacting transcriptional regulator [Planctomycetota bacterium]